MLQILIFERFKIVPDLIDVEMWQILMLLRMMFTMFQFVVLAFCTLNISSKFNSTLT
jgi:hypothetical protein